jgi:hypothetical protein
MTPAAGIRDLPLERQRFALALDRPGRSKSRITLAHHNRKASMPKRWDSISNRHGLFLIALLSLSRFINQIG